MQSAGSEFEVTWQAAVVVSLWAGWVWFHLWIGRAHLWKTGLAVVGIELICYVALVVSINLQLESSIDKSGNMAGGIIVAIGFFVLTLPALLCLASLFWHRNKVTESI